MSSIRDRAAAKISAMADQSLSADTRRAEASMEGSRRERKRTQLEQDRIEARQSELRVAVAAEGDGGLLEDGLGLVGSLFGFGGPSEEALELERLNADQARVDAEAKLIRSSLDESVGEIGRASERAQMLHRTAHQALADQAAETQGRGRQSAGVHLPGEAITRVLAAQQDLAEASSASSEQISEGARARFRDAVEREHGATLEAIDKRADAGLWGRILGPVFALVPGLGALSGAAALGKLGAALPSIAVGAVESADLGLGLAKIPQHFELHAASAAELSAIESRSARDSAQTRLSEQEARREGAKSSISETWQRADRLRQLMSKRR